MMEGRREQREAEAAASREQQEAEAATSREQQDAGPAVSRGQQEAGAYVSRRHLRLSGAEGPPERRVETDWRPGNRWIMWSWPSGPPPW